MTPMLFTSKGVIALAMSAVVVSLFAGAVRADDAVGPPSTPNEDTPVRSFAGQSPIAGATVLGWYGNFDQETAQATVSAEGQTVVWERGDNERGPFSAGGAWVAHSRNDTADKRTFVLAFDSSSVASDSGWYRAVLRDGNGNVTNQTTDPVFIKLVQATHGWDNGQKESGPSWTVGGGTSSAECPAGQVFIGRQHRGDENGTTWTRCAYLQVGDKHQIAIADTSSNGNTVKVSGKESRSGYDGTGECPANTWIVRRDHHGDENGETTTWCAHAYVAGQQVKARNNYWPGDIKESAGTVFTCKDVKGNIPGEWDSVGSLTRGMTGRLHWKDENGPTEYICSEPYLP